MNIEQKDNAAYSTLLAHRSYSGHNGGNPNLQELLTGLMHFATRNGNEGDFDEALGLARAEYLKDLGEEA